MNSRILAFAGNKQSGKSTSSNFLHGYQLRCQGIIESFYVVDTGELVVTTNVINENGDEEKGEAILDITRQDLEFAEWAMYSMWPFVKKYSFASPLKEIATGLFGLTHEQCYGTDEQKNTLTNIRWGDLPTANKKSKKKKLTAREFLQYFGTDICRSVFTDIWVDRCIADIRHEEPLVAIIDDCRFPNEADAIQKAGGKVIRLTRSLHKDSHKSESALDDWDNFDAIIDNQHMSMQDTAKKLIETLDVWGWLGKEVTPPEINPKFANQIAEAQVPSESTTRGIHTIKSETAE
jgi:hypothetical protein